MPITIDKFKEAQSPLTERIKEFLEQNKDKAFTVSEIIKEIEKPKDPQWFVMQLILELAAATTAGGHTRTSLIQKYNSAIEELLSKGLIEKSEIEGATYLAIKGNK